MRSYSGCAPKQRTLGRHPAQLLMVPAVLAGAVVRAPVDPACGAAAVGASAALLVMKWPTQGMSSWRLEVGLAGHLALAMLASSWYSMEGGPAGAVLGLVAARVVLAAVGAAAVLFSLLELVGREAVMRRLTVEAVRPLQPFFSQLGETLDALVDVVEPGRALESPVERAVRRARACRHQLSNLALVSRSRPLAEGVAPVIATLCELLDPATVPFPVDHVRVVRDLGCGEQMVKVPAPYLELLFWNLADNAFRASGERAVGMVGVVVRTTSGGVQVVFADDGAGVEERERDRALIALAAPAEGRLHLGLAASRKIAEAYGGALELAARPGGGTVVTVTLPTAPREN